MFSFLQDSVQGKAQLERLGTLTSGTYTNGVAFIQLYIQEKHQCTKSWSGKRFKYKWSNRLFSTIGHAVSVFYYSLLFILDELRVYAEEIILLEPKGYGGKAAWAFFTVNTLRVRRSKKYQYYR